jgi:hypothetical protein
MKAKHATDVKLLIKLCLDFLFYKFYLWRVFDLLKVVKMHVAFLGGSRTSLPGVDCLRDIFLADCLHPNPLGSLWREGEFIPKGTAYINLLKPTSYGMHQQVEYLTIVHSTHTVYLCFLFV